MDGLNGIEKSEGNDIREAKLLDGFGGGIFNGFTINKKKIATVWAYFVYWRLSAD